MRKQTSQDSNDDTMAQVSDLVDLSERPAKPDPQVQNGEMLGHIDPINEFNGQNSVFENESSCPGQDSFDSELNRTGQNTSSSVLSNTIQDSSSSALSNTSQDSSGTELGRSSQNSSSSALSNTIQDSSSSALSNTSQDSSGTELGRTSQNSSSSALSKTSQNSSSSGSNAEQSRTREPRAPLLSHGSGYRSEDTPTNADTSILTVLAGLRQGAREKKLSDGDSAGYDTHSDSIETLEEESSHEDISNDLSDSLVRQISLTGSHDPNSDPETLKMEKEDDLDILAPRPESLSLPRPAQQFERIRSSSEAQIRSKSDPRVRKDVQDKLRTQSEIIEIKTGTGADINLDNYLSKSLPHGTIMRKGEMIEFVAEDLQEKIRRSSPMSRTESSCYSSRRSSLRSVSSSTSATTSMATSTASGVSRSPSSLFQQSPDDMPPIDPQALFDLENQALLVADSIDLMMGNLRSNLHKMSSITIGCLDAYRHSVDTTCESVDGSIKSMYALMAKCEELSRNMQPVYKLSEKIKEIKRLLDLFEAQLIDKT